jgi:tRNA 2-thiouridine synthesizing protein D
LKLNYCLLVTGPAYGTQQASSAWQFAQALLAAGHKISSVFFYREGVLNANQLTSPANDEFDLVRAWITLSRRYSIELNVCVAAALRRGVIDEQETVQLGLGAANLQDGFILSGLGRLAEAALSCDRLIQF